MVFQAPLPSVVCWELMGWHGAHEEARAGTSQAGFGDGD